MSNQGFECMFCGRAIEGDPLQVVLIRHSDAGRPDAPTASYWTHLACLRDRANPPTRGYLEAWETESN